MAHTSQVLPSELAAASSRSGASAAAFPRRLNHLRALEAESIHILREAAAEFARPVMLYSIGKDSSVMLRLAQKAFFPGKIPFPLLDALTESGFDAAFGGARRDEEKSRAKERIYSFRDSLGQWDPKNQRPELWSIFNSRIDKGESIRVFPLSNWTELDIWLYIQAENIPIVSLYFAKEREVVLRNGSIVLIHSAKELLPDEKVQILKCRMRSLGCVPCTGAIGSEADSVAKIVEEMISFRRSERENRAIDHDEEGSMELKKREGYF